MRKMLGWLLVSVSMGTLLPNRVDAQTPAAPGAAGLDAVVQELRLLRRAVERQNTTSARTQLLLARLSLQDQRVARSRQAVERLEAELLGAERERSQLQVGAREMTRALERATDPTERQSLEQESRMMRSRLTATDSAVDGVQTRLAQAKQVLEADTARYDELESWLTDVEREFQRDSS